jgi:hypothetical protein
MEFQPKKRKRNWEFSFIRPADTVLTQKLCWECDRVLRGALRVYENKVNSR